MRKILVIHPYLFSLWVIFFLFAEEIQDYHFIDLFLPMFVVLALTLALLLGLSLVIDDVRVNALIVSPLIIFLLSYGFFYDYILINFQQMRYYIIPILTLLGLCLYGVYCVRLLKGISINSIIIITNIFNVIAIIITITNLSHIVLYYYNNDATLYNYHQHDYALNYKFAGPPPDIYYIILDEYAGLDQAKTFFNYDNSAFVDRLKQRGFYVAEKSESKYIQTAFSLATSLNMEFPKRKSNGTEFSSISSSVSNYLNIGKKSPISDYVRNNNVTRLLKSIKYKYFHLGSWFYATRFSRYADFNFNYIGFNMNNSLLTELSMVSILRVVQINRYYQRQLVINSFLWLSRVVAFQGPKFVFAHITCPHRPFLFDAEGGVVPSYERENIKDKAIYLGQYIFVTKEIQEVIEVIINKSKTPPIIILQSDHGVRWDKKSARKIFNAYLLPNNGNSLLYDNISPVNTFRLIFNYYFNAKYDLIDDSRTALK